jgi:aldehyde:ferredoxin oxidoreductase
MKGNTGKIIVVDLGLGNIRVEELPEEYYRKYVGGSGLAAKLFWERGDFAAPPLAGEALLLFMNGPLAGLKLSGASRHATAGRSPLTGHWGDSSSGGFFAPELRYAGYDGLFITGKASIPSLILIEDERIEIQDAGAYWGKGAMQVSSLLKLNFGSGWRTLIIGPAGENLVPFSNIISDGHHATGRAGFGAVMGSKNLKAIMVKARERKYPAAHPEKLEELRKKLQGKIKDSVTATVLGEHGTAANLLGGIYAGDVPIKNWTSNFWEEAGEALTGSTLTEKYLTGRGACAYCTIACKRIVKVEEGPYAIPEGPGPEYETIVSFGTMIGAMDLAAACKAGRLCNELGLDSISAGATIAWAMEAFERGDLTCEDTGGIPLIWGDVETVINKLLPLMAFREEPLGALLSRGSVAAAKKIGGKAMQYTVHSKGLEAPMHDPRGGGHGLALTYAVSPRGACHVADPMLFVEMGARYYPEVGLDFELSPREAKDKPEAAAISIPIGAIENSACFCQFADGEFSIDDWLDLFNLAADYGWDREEFLKAGRRIFYLKKMINARFGLSAGDDSLSPRMLEAARDGEPEGIAIDFTAMKEKFYRLMGLDPLRGIPVREVLEAHGLSLEGNWFEQDHEPTPEKPGAILVKE